jgi:hypothetical protein
MAAYEHLRICRRLMELTIFVEQTVRHLPRYYKNSLGSEVRAMCHQALGLLMDANSARIDDGAIRCDGTGQGCPPDQSTSHQNLIVNGCKLERLQALQAGLWLVAGCSRHHQI